MILDSIVLHKRDVALAEEAVAEGTNCAYTAALEREARQMIYAAKFRLASPKPYRWRYFGCLAFKRKQ